MSVALRPPREDLARRLLFPLLVTLLACTSFVDADDDDDDDEDEVTSVSCGDNLSKPGRYRLDGDLVCNATINITGSHIDFNLRGHSITCSGPEVWEYPAEAADTPPEDLNVWVKGITVNFVDVDQPQADVEDISIRNGSITNCWVGIQWSDVRDSRISNMNLSGNRLDAECCSSRGIETVRADGNRIVRNHLNGNGLGIGMFSSAGNLVARNQIEGNAADGIFLLDSAGNRVRRNDVGGNEWGIWLENSSDNTVAANSVYDNNQDGVLAIGLSDGNAIMRNELVDNNTGIILLGIPEFGIPVPAGNVIRRNTALGSELDVGEFNIIDFFGDFELVPPEECANTWMRNVFDTALGPENCIE